MKSIVKSTLVALAAGTWLQSKAQQQQFTSGTFQAARNLRKQGAPLEVALALLVGRV